MHTTNTNTRKRPNDPTWQFLGEYSPSEWISEHDHNGEEFKAGKLFQTLRELGIPPEFLDNIGIMLTRIATGSMVQRMQGSLELPACVRIFSQKKIMEGANSAQMARLPGTEPSVENAPMMPHPGTKDCGGWGCFLIERQETLPADNSQRWVELYLYREG